MKKNIFPILLGVLTLFFSGKSIAHKNCGPVLTISNFPPIDSNHILLPVTQVIVTNYSWGTTAVYDHPSFPFNYYGSGGYFKVSYVFDGPSYKACVYLEDANVECLQSQSNNNATTADISFGAYDCNQYYIGAYNLLNFETCQCGQ